MIDRSRQASPGHSRPAALRGHGAHFPARGSVEWMVRGTLLLFMTVVWMCP